jgi:hypothetical protein
MKAEKTNLISNMLNLSPSRNKLVKSLIIYLSGPEVLSTQSVSFDSGLIYTENYVLMLDNIIGIRAVFDETALIKESVSNDVKSVIDWFLKQK